MMLIEHEARVGLPRMWEHPRRTRTRRGGVVASMVGGYTAILCFASMFVRQVRQCFSVVWADGFPRCRHRFPVM